MITHVAIKYRGKLYSLPAPNRHHHIIWQIFEETNEQVDAYGDDQGFLNEDGIYFNRHQALIHAFINGQIIDLNKVIRAGWSNGKFYHARLTSEDVWLTHSPDEP